MSEEQVDSTRGEQIEALCVALFNELAAAHDAGTSQVEILRALAIITGAAINEFPNANTVRILFDQLLDFSMTKAAKHFPHDRPAVN